MRMADKIVVLTGGSGDLGGATARLLATEGATVVNIDRVAAGGWDGLAIKDVVADITNPAEVERAIDDAVAEFGAPHVLVNAAGIIGRPAPSHESTVEEFDRIFDVNVKGVWLMTRAVVPHMIQARRGSIVNFSSIHGITGGKNVPLYHATKGAVRLLSKSDAAAYGEYGIRVNSIHPGSMDTRMSRILGGAQPDRARGLLPATGRRQPAAPTGQAQRDRLRRALPRLRRSRLHHRRRARRRRWLHRSLTGI